MQLPRVDIREELNESTERMKVIDGVEDKTVDTMVIENLKPYTHLYPTAEGLMENPKGFEAYVKHLVRASRSSEEYRKFINFLKSELELTKCTFLGNVDTSELKGVKLEFHHYPFTIFELVSIVLEKHIQMDPEGVIDEFIIVNEVMELHYKGMVGLVPLTETPHQMAHNGALFIPLSVPIGNIKKFVREYNPYLTDAMKNKLIQLINMSNEVDKKYVSTSLNKRVTLMDVKGHVPIGKVEIPEKDEQKAE